MAISLRSGNKLHGEPPKAIKEVDVDLNPPQGIPKYSMYLRYLVASKIKLQYVEAVALTEECSFKVTQKMPKKVKDPRKFTLPIQIGNNEVVQKLSDLGESINLMPLYLFNTLGLGKPIQSSVLLQLVDKKVPIILGYPFLAMGGAFIDVREGTLKMRLQNEEAVEKKSVYQKPKLKSIAKIECGVPTDLLYV
ncbi:uncharacterized protein LOC124898470 [Capsicum annuum]|uniref:uncharacterized protein LOC124898470 n=1 Tax=Capsicum annuum TaxID=4072 RepID=UPI001FB12D69|nr:uncharacterized protein LOC124898470 [Capsicum annuum]